MKGFKTNLTEEQKVRLKKRVLVADIFLVVVILLVGGYVAMNVEHLKSADSPCQVCVERHGASCFLNGTAVYEESIENMGQALGQNPGPTSSGS